MKYGIAIVDQICLLEHLALHMLQALNLVILGNHGLNQILLGLHNIIVISIIKSLHARTCTVPVISGACLHKSASTARLQRTDGTIGAISTRC